MIGDIPTEATIPAGRQVICVAPDVLREAIGIVAGRVTTEASGDINFETVHAIAEAGVDLITVRALTHSVTVFDIGLDTPIT